MALFGEALRFGFRPFRRIWWYWLNLIPVLGWIMFAGYSADILKKVVEEGADSLPKFGRFWPTFKTGLLLMIIATILGWIMTLLSYIPWIWWLLALVAYFLIPIMIVQYAVTRSFRKGFDVMSAARLIYKNFTRYIIYILVSFAVALVLLAASLPIITILVTMPAMSYASLYIFGRFYQEATAQKKTKKRGSKK